jgi:hypothetical protein
MSESRKQQEVEAVRRKQRGRRVKRGLVAGYLHELSGRHAAATNGQPRSLSGEPLSEPSRSA